MAAKQCHVEVTANFEANLDVVAAFLAEAGAPQAFAALVDTIAASVIPNLERFPDMGRPFLDRPADSVEARERIHRLQSSHGKAVIREYVLDDFLILYAVRGESVYLLAIKHHRQLSFDLPSHWR